MAEIRAGIRTPDMQPSIAIRRLHVFPEGTIMARSIGLDPAIAQRLERLSAQTGRGGCC